MARRFLFFDWLILWFKELYSQKRGSVCVCVWGGGGGTRGVAQLSARWCTRSFAQTNTWICFLVVASSIFEHVCIYLTGFTLMVFQFITVSVFVTSGVEFELNRVHNAILYHSKQPLTFLPTTKETFQISLTIVFATSFLPATICMSASMVFTGQQPSSVIGPSVVSGGLMSARKQRVDWVGNSSKSEGKPRNLRVNWQNSTIHYVH